MNIFLIEKCVCIYSHSNVQINIQRFPYPESVEEQYPENIIYLLTLIGFIFLALTLPHYIAVERNSGMKVIFKLLFIYIFILLLLIIEQILT